MGLSLFASYTASSGKSYILSGVALRLFMVIQDH